MMPPRPRADIAPSAACESRITAVTRTSSIACSCSTSLSRNRRFSPKPALLTSRSTGRSSVGEPRLDAGQLVTVGQVGGQHLDLRRRTRRAARRRPSRAARCRGPRATRSWPRAGELAGEGEADAGGRAGDEGGLEAWRRSRTRCRAAIPRTRVRHDGADDCHATTTLAIANQKGGVAKTTTVASLGAALAELGHSVLLVDLDPQACLTFSLGIDPEDLELSIHHVLTKGPDASRGRSSRPTTASTCCRPPSSWPAPRPTCSPAPAASTCSRPRSRTSPRTATRLRLGAARLPAVAGRAHRRRAHRRRRRADPAPVRDAVAPRRRPAARHRARRTPVHQPRPRGVGRAADAVRRPHQPRAHRAGDDLRHLRPRGDRAADPQDHQVRRGAGRRPVDPGDHPQQQGRAGLPRGRGQPACERRPTASPRRSATAPQRPEPAPGHRSVRPRYGAARALRSRRWRSP